jgi:hypothetical protein
MKEHLREQSSSKGQGKKTETETKKIMSTSIDDNVSHKLWIQKQK